MNPYPQPPAQPAYQVTALDNFDFYEDAGVPTKCRDAEHALSVAKGILERSLSHEHAQANDRTSAAELFDRWDSFGDYPSIYPELDPPFKPSEYAQQRAAEICATWQPDQTDATSAPGMLDATDEEQDAGDLTEGEGEESANDCYAFHAEDSYPVGQLVGAVRRVMKRPELSTDDIAQLRVFLFALERLPLVTPGVRMSLGLRLDQGGESDWIEIRIEDDTFTLGRGSWIDGDADTETHFEVSPDYRDGDAFVASNFARSFQSCAEDVCREVVIEDSSDEPFDGWNLEKDKSRWGTLPCSFL